MPVAVELNGLLPGRGPGRGLPWRGDDGAAVPPDELPCVRAAGAETGPGRGDGGRAAGFGAAAGPGSSVSGRPCGNGTGGGAGALEVPASAAAGSAAGVAAGAAGWAGLAAVSWRGTAAAGLAAAAVAVAAALARPLDLA
jgi:hypothetical protein